MNAHQSKTRNRLLNLISIILVLAFVAVCSILIVKFVQVKTYNRRLQEIKAEIEDDYQKLLEQSEKLKDDTYYTIYFEDQYMVVDRDKIIIEFK